MFQFARMLFSIFSIVPVSLQRTRIYTIIYRITMTQAYHGIRTINWIQRNIYVYVMYDNHSKPKPKVSLKLEHQQSAESCMLRNYSYTFLVLLSMQVLQMRTTLRRLSQYRLDYQCIRNQNRRHESLQLYLTGIRIHSQRTPHHLYLIFKLDKTLTFCIILFLQTWSCSRTRRRASERWIVHGML